MANSFSINIDDKESSLYEVVRIAGYESLSQTSVYEMTLLSKDSDVKAPSILGKKIDVKYTFVDSENKKHERFCSGVAVRLIRGRRHERLYEYQVTVRSWFWLLSKKQNSRIFQDKTVLEIVDIILSDKPISQFKDIDPAGVKQKHVKRNYCVQYQETDFDFISRLLESEGIYYWFDCHDKHGKMLLSDSSNEVALPLPAGSIINPVPNGASESRFNQISAWHSSDRIDSHAFAGQDLSYRSIATPQAGEMAATEYFDGGLENYEYPYGYFSNEGSADSAEFTLSVEEDSALVDARFHELSSRKKRYWANTLWPDVASGATFTFEGAKSDARNGDYLIASCAFLLTEPASVNSTSKAVAHPAPKVVLENLRQDPLHTGTLEFVQHLLERANVFQDKTGSTRSFLTTLLSQKSTFSPQRVTRRKIMPGPQTAQVVGAEGEELKVDKLGRVKVKFFWERDRTTKNNTSCWIRVSQPMAGQGWGGYFAPRVGQEVIVDFLNGDPDSPIIVGRVYNDFNDVPYQSPTQSGFKTRSTPKGAASDFNEIRFEDKKGSEELALHGQKNVSITAEANESVSVGANQGVNVGHNRTVGVGNNETYLVKVDQNNFVGGTQSSVTVGLQTNILKAGQFTKVTGGEQTIVAAAGQSIKAKGQRTKVEGFRKLEVSENDDIGITGYQTTKVGIDYAVIADGNVKLKAGKKRVDVTTGDHWVLSSASYKLSADAGIQFMTPASIDSTSMGSNTTIMGQNSSGYVGMDSSFTLALSRSTFMGIAMSNTYGAGISNFGGAAMDNFAGLKISSTVAASLELAAIEGHSTGLFSVTPGAGSAALNSSTGVMVSSIAAVIAWAGGGFVAVIDGDATAEQYKKAKEQLKEAAKMARDEKLTKLASRLDALADTGLGDHFFSDSLPDAPTERAKGTVEIGEIDMVAIPANATETQRANIQRDQAERLAANAQSEHDAAAQEVQDAAKAIESDPSEKGQQRLDDARKELSDATENLETRNEIAKDAALNAKDAAANEAAESITKQADKTFPKSPPKPAP
jgi:type VI secretion system secreted protein VgrG